MVAGREWPRNAEQALGRTGGVRRLCPRNVDRDLGLSGNGRVLPRSIRAGPSGDRGVPGRHFLEHLVCMRSDLERVLERIRVSFAGRGLGSLVDWASEKLGCCWVSLIYFLFIFLFNQIN